MSKGVYWIPNDCEDARQVRCLDLYVRILKDWARKDASFRKNREQLLQPYQREWPCSVQNCDGLGVEVHHRKPLWVCSLEFICARLAITRDSVYSAHFEALIFSPPSDYLAQYAKWNALENLQLLCAPCHNTAGIEANRFHTVRLQKQYFPALCFSYPEAQQRFEARL